MADENLASDAPDEKLLAEGHHSEKQASHSAKQTKFSP